MRNYDAVARRALALGAALAVLSTAAGRTLEVTGGAAGLVQALAAARATPRDGGPVTLHLAPGDYAFPDGLALDARDSWLVLRGAPGARLTRAVRATPGGTVACDAPAYPDTEGTFGAMRPHAPMFFYDGRWATEARWPNAGWASFTADQVVESGLHGRCLGGVKPDAPATSGAFRLDTDRARRWDFAAGVWMAGYPTHDWSFERIRLASFDPTNRVLKMAGVATFGLNGETWSEFKGHRFYVYGVRAELDAPGEYYYDRRSGRVDFIAPKGMTNFWAVTKAGPVVSVKEARDVAFENLTLEYAVGEGFRLDRCTNVVVLGTRILNVGGYGVMISGGCACRVVRTEIAHCGLGGVQAFAGDRRTLTPCGHVVADCEIHDFSRISRTYSPALHVGGCGVTARGCRIHDSPHSACIYGGNDHLFEGNEVWDILYETGDAGAFYTGRNPTSRGNVLRGNYVHDIGHPERAKLNNVMAFYIDDCDAGETLVGNRVRNAPRGLMLGGGHDNHILSNVFENCNLAVSVDARGVAWKEHWDSPSWTMTKKVTDMPVGEEPWRSRYPLLVNYLNDGPREPRHISFVGNVFRRCKAIWQWQYGMEKYLHLLDRRDNVVE